MDLSEAKQIVASWSETKPEIGRVWFYGSRVRGEDNEDSDLDIAIEIDMESVKNNDFSEFGLATFIHNRRRWSEELSSTIPILLDLKQYRPVDDNKVKEGVERSSILVYEKNS